MNDKERLRRKRHVRVRAKVRGSADRPRLNVFRSLKHVYVQLIDDDAGHTLVAASTAEPTFRETGKSGGNLEGARAVGALIAERAKEQGLASVVFDRGGYRYHGRVKSLADAARENGLEF